MVMHAKLAQIMTLSRDQGYQFVHAGKTPAYDECCMLRLDSTVRVTRRTRKNSQAHSKCANWDFPISQNKM